MPSQRICGGHGAGEEAVTEKGATGRGDGKPAPIRREDFSAKELSEDVYVNKVGTFGVSSAGYWWGRAGGGIMRLGHYCVGVQDALLALLYSDDGK